MKVSSQSKQKLSESFSVKALDKKSLKARAFTTLKTSFAIEGIHFTPTQLSNLRAKSHLKK
jgi:hypothetical protein